MVAWFHTTCNCIGTSFHSCLLLGQTGISHFKVKTDSHTDCNKA